MDNYVETGNKIPITLPELKNHVTQLLSDYDSGKVSEESSSNPYTEDIVYKTKDGHLIKIPKEIQQEVVNQWVASKGGGAGEGGLSTPPSNLPHSTPPQIPEQSPTTELDVPEESDESGSGIYLALFIFLIICAILFFLFDGQRFFS